MFWSLPIFIPQKVHFGLCLSVWLLLPCIRRRLCCYRRSRCSLRPATEIEGLTMPLTAGGAVRFLRFRVTSAHQGEISRRSHPKRVMRTTSNLEFSTPSQVCRINAKQIMRPDGLDLCSDRVVAELTPWSQCRGRSQLWGRLRRLPRQSLHSRRWDRRGPAHISRVLER